MYGLIKKCLFMLPPELSHYLALKSLDLAYRLGLLKPYKAPVNDCHQLIGLNFPHRLGLAAGLDKNADHVDALAALGFAFIEIGTVTPKAQIGNPKPRLFRLVREQAIINRMGFNNKGADYVARRLDKINFKGILGINIGKNRDTPNENAIDDYLYCFQKLWPYASYITINISSPNTKSLRNLQSSEALTSLLSSLKAEQLNIHRSQHKYVPLLVKIAPDLSEKEIREIAGVLKEQQMDGVIATNTSTSREGLSDSKFAAETGGLSGRPITQYSTRCIEQLRQHLPADFPIIASGGIMDEDSAKEKLSAGANLLQVYTGFIYEGSGLISRLSR